MILAKIKVSGLRATPCCIHEIPAGIIGGKIAFEYTDPMWNDLTKTVVVMGTVTKDILDAGDTVTIPAECVAKPSGSLRVGVYGTDADGVRAIPTLWADLGRIRAAADPSGDESADPQLPVWAQLQEQIDDLKENGTGSVDESVIQEMVGDYLQKNPPPAGEKGKDGEDGGYYTPEVTQPAEDTLQFDFAPSKADMPAVEPVQVKLPVPESGGNVAYDEAQELTDEQKAQARENIGAQPAGNYLTEVPKGYAKTSDIPTELKNPNALTFTGAVSATYDGSEAVTVEIPESSGGGNTEWKKIVSIEIADAETSKLYITEDIDGNTLEIDKKHRWKVISTNANYSANGYLDLQLNKNYNGGTTVSVACRVSTFTGSETFLFEVEPFINEQLYIRGQCITSDTRGVRNTTELITFDGCYDGENITKIGVNLKSGVYYTEGTIIEVYEEVSV